MARVGGLGLGKRTLARDMGKGADIGFALSDPIKTSVEIIRCRKDALYDLLSRRPCIVLVDPVDPHCKLPPTLRAGR